jgi:hypothetical protein
MGKNSDPGSRIKLLDHISKSLKQFFGVKNTLILCCGSGSGIWCIYDPGSGIQDRKIRIREEKIRILDPGYTFRIRNTSKKLHDFVGNYGK